MTTTTTPHATAPGPVVVHAYQIPAPSYLAMTSAVDRFRQADTAMRESLEPVARMARDLGAEVARMASASETVARQIAATSDAETQRFVCDLSAARRIFTVAIDDPSNGSAYSAGVIRRPPFTIAISSSGEAPASATITSGSSAAMRESR